MNPNEYDIANKLQTALFGTIAGTSDWGIYIEHMPDLPQNCISLYAAPSPPPEQPSEGTTRENLLEYCYFQVQVRSSTFIGAWEKAKAIARYLNGLSRFFVTDPTDAPVRYSSVRQVSDFLPMATMDKQSYIRTVNFRTIRQELFE